MSLSTFVAVTGPKADVWLVHTVGALAMAIGATLLVGARREQPTRETAALGALSALAFAAVETWYGLRGVISWVYLADAALEVALALAWGGAWALARSGEPPRRSASR